MHCLPQLTDSRVFDRNTGDFFVYEFIHSLTYHHHHTRLFQTEVDRTIKAKERAKTYTYFRVYQEIRKVGPTGVEKSPV